MAKNRGSLCMAQKGSRQSLYVPVSGLLPVSGLNDDRAVAESIWWNRFSLRAVWRVDGVQMRYEPIAYATAAAMLSAENGEGNCAAWADLLKSVLSAQGVVAGKRKAEPKHTPVNYDLMRVTGTVQGGDTGSWDFNWHALVSLGAVIYDPSIGTRVEGTGTLSAEQNWEATQVKKLHGPGLSPDWIDNPAGDQVGWSDLLN